MDGFTITVYFLLTQFHANDFSIHWLTNNLQCVQWCMQTTIHQIETWIPWHLPEKLFPNAKIPNENLPDCTLNRKLLARIKFSSRMDICPNKNYFNRNAKWNTLRDTVETLKHYIQYDVWKDSGQEAAHKWPHLCAFTGCERPSVLGLSTAPLGVDDPGPGGAVVIIKGLEESEHEHALMRRWHPNRTSETEGRDSSGAASFSCAAHRIRWGTCSSVESVTAAGGSCMSLGKKVKAAPKKMRVEY